MIGEFGMKRVNQGLTLAIDAIPSFPPTPAEIRKYVPPLEIVTCGNCDSGWIRDGSKDKFGNEAVKRCECLQRV
jgi:hypothetical protein